MAGPKMSCPFCGNGMKSLGGKVFSPELKVLVYQCACPDCAARVSYAVSQQAVIVPPSNGRTQLEHSQAPDPWEKTIAEKRLASKAR